MKKSIIIAAIITVAAMIGVLIYYFLPKEVSYTFEGEINRGVDEDGFSELYPATLEISGKVRGKTFEGIVSFTVDGKVQTVEAVAEIVKYNAWQIINKDADKNGVQLEITFMPNYKKYECSAIIKESTVHNMAYNIFFSSATDED